MSPSTLPFFILGKLKMRLPRKRGKGSGGNGRLDFQVDMGVEVAVTAVVEVVLATVRVGTSHKGQVSQGTCS